jgi:hypothetical protein
VEKTDEVGAYYETIHRLFSLYDSGTFCLNLLLRQSIFPRLIVPVILGLRQYKRCLIPFVVFIEFRPPESIDSCFWYPENYGAIRPQLLFLEGSFLLNII